MLPHELVADQEHESDAAADVAAVAYTPVDVIVVPTGRSRGGSGQEPSHQDSRADRRAAGRQHFDTESVE